MTQNVNLNSLRVFAAAARHGNFQRAAEVLNLSHGAVSQRIKQLELDLGVVLFERKARGVSLTNNGERYRDAVEKALSLLATAGADLERAGDQVTLHLGPSFASRWFIPRLKDFTTRYPDVTLTTEVHQNLIKRRLGRNEIAIWPGKMADRVAGQHVRQLADVQLVAVCSPYLLRPHCPMDIEALLTLPLLQDGHRRWERLIEGSGHRAKPSLLNFGRAALALDAAVKGHGVAIAPTYMIDEDLVAGRLVELWRSPDIADEFLFMSWSEHENGSRQMQQTVDWILSEFDLDAEFRGARMYPRPP
ncbi:MAG: LysR family transcriptional regulator [Natronohydrobacter sp.]|nr:LysR family transcriptional regulator [Natronohydrobacter sp.]